MPVFYKNISKKIEKINLTKVKMFMKFQDTFQDETSKDITITDEHLKEKGEGNHYKKHCGNLRKIKKGGLKPFLNLGGREKGLPNILMVKDTNTREHKEVQSSKKCKKNMYFYINENNFIQSGLNFRQYNLLQRIELFSRKDKEVISNNKYFAEHLKCCTKTVTRDLHILEEKGLIKLTYKDYINFAGLKLQTRIIKLTYELKEDVLSHPRDKMSHNNNIINNINKDVEEISPLGKKIIAKEKPLVKKPIVQGYIFRTFKKECIRLDIAISDLVLIEEAHKFFAYWQEKSFLDSTGKKIHIRSKIASWIHHDKGVFGSKLNEKTKLLNEKLEQVKEKQVQQQEKAYAESLEGQIDTLSTQLYPDLIEKYKELGFVESRKRALQEATILATQIILGQTKNINKMNKNVDFKEDFTQNKNQVLFNLKSDTNLNLFTGSVV